MSSMGSLEHNRVIFCEVSRDQLVSDYYLMEVRLIAQRKMELGFRASELIK